MKKRVAAPLDKGMAGHDPIGTCHTSAVDAKKGLSIRGIPIATLFSSHTFLETVQLLLTGNNSEDDTTKLDNELRKLRNTASQENGVLTQTLKHIKTLPKGDPISLLIAGLSYLKLHLQSQDHSFEFKEDMKLIFACLPDLIGAVIEHKYNAELGKPTSSQTYTNYLGTLLKVDSPEDLGKWLLLHLDHGGGPASTFAAKVVGSTRANAFSCLIAGLEALSGQRHGKANQDVLAFLTPLLQQLGPPPSIEDLEQNTQTAQDYLSSLKTQLQSVKILPGFGHRVLREEDPRATCLIQNGKETLRNHALFRLVLCYRQVGKELLTERGKATHANINVDCVSGTILMHHLEPLGVTDPTVALLFFAFARTFGALKQVDIEIDQNLPIIRPRYVAAGANSSQETKEAVLAV